MENQQAMVQNIPVTSNNFSRIFF